MEQIENITNNNTTSPDAIDFGKLAIIIRKNFVWIALIFILINSLAYLFIRYTKNLYQSTSEIKLDVKSEASGLGIKAFADDQSSDLLSGEIEVITSKLFLSRLLQHTDLEISFFSVGHVLNEELFFNSPANVSALNSDHDYYNKPIEFTETSDKTFVLSTKDQNLEISGEYGDPVLFDNLELMITRNTSFKKGDEVGYYFLINSKDVLLSYLINNLSAEPINYNANIIGLTFKDHNPQKAQAVLHKIDTVYLQYSNEQKNLINRQKIDWLTKELGRIEKRMEDYEDYFKQFTLENKTNDLNEDLQNTIQSINQIDSQRYELTRRIRETERLINDLTENEFYVPASMRESLPSSLNTNLDKLAELSVVREKLKLSYQEITFAFRENDRQIQVLQTKTLGELKELKLHWTRQLRELNDRKKDLDQQFENFPDKNTEFTKNQRFYKLYEEFYLTLMQSKAEFEIAQAGTVADYKILAPASMPEVPISPNKPIIAGIGFVASIVANFFFIGILYLLNNKITSITELDNIRSAALLGSLPESKHPTDTGLYIIDHPKSMMSEAIRTLRTNLDFFNVTAQQKVVAISSTVSGEGKSFIAMNLGAVLALSKKKVILIDLDMRKEKAHLPVVDVDNTKGVSTILIRKHNWKDCITKTIIDTLDFLPAGPHPPNPSELLLNGEFTDLLTELKSKYDYIILDTPPVGLVTDGIMAMRRADISIYVFRANYSKREFLSNVHRIISINKITNLTTVLNAVPTTGKPNGYGYYEESKKPTNLKSLLRT